MAPLSPSTSTDSGMSQGAAPALWGRRPSAAPSVASRAPPTAPLGRRPSDGYHSMERRPPLPTPYIPHSDVTPPPAHAQYVTFQQVVETEVVRVRETRRVVRRAEEEEEVNFEEEEEEVNIEEEEEEELVRVYEEEERAVAQVHSSSA